MKFEPTCHPYLGWSELLSTHIGKFCRLIWTLLRPGWVLTESESKSPTLWISFDLSFQACTRRLEKRSKLKLRKTYSIDYWWYAYVIINAISSSLRLLCFWVQKFGTIVVTFMFTVWIANRETSIHASSFFLSFASVAYRSSIINSSFYLDSWSSSLFSVCPISISSSHWLIWSRFRLS